MSILIMLLSAGAIILFVRFGLVSGIDQLARALNWSPKLRGQATGYATSAPELVVLVAAGLAGVWEAGLWNIAASNIINSGLFVAAVFFYKQGGDLKHRRFFDEIAFAVMAIAMPLLLMSFALDKSWIAVPLLFGFFIVYRIVDTKLNKPPVMGATDAVGSVPMGVILVVTAVVLIAVSGIFLGGATEAVVRQLGVHPAIAGWVLGVITSLPEMVTFFSVYGTAKKEGNLHLVDDTQEALDNLTTSNMANTGLIYPIGLCVYLVVASALGS